MEKRNMRLWTIIVIVCCILSGVLAGIFSAVHFTHDNYYVLSNLAQKMIDLYPQDEQKIIGLIKENSSVYDTEQTKEKNYLSAYGYEAEDFFSGQIEKSMLVSIVLVIAILGLLFCLLSVIKRRHNKRIEVLTDYLVKLNTGKEVQIFQAEEDCFSELQDEMYKTMTNMYQTRESAVAAKKNYADNLANIAHQIKTPLTSISIMTQLLNHEWKEEYVKQIHKQTERLTKLAEALLTLSRIDAGVLELEKKQVDVYTMLQLAVESLSDITKTREVSILLEERGEISFWGDMEWMMEAFMNLIKNCIQHTRKVVRIDYSQNPIYTEIKVWDDGEGFSGKDLPYVFERFYRGNRVSEGGIGIGLSLAKSVIEMHNGCIEAKNLSEGGACYFVRIYSH